MEKISLTTAVSALDFIEDHLQKSNAILGVWLNYEKDARIEIYKECGKLYGKLIWAKNLYEIDKNAIRKDNRNANEQLRSRDLLNIHILADFIYYGDYWIDGRIYDPKSGKTYAGMLKLKENDLEIRGLMGFIALGTTTVWTRSKN